MQVRFSFILPLLLVAIGAAGQPARKIPGITVKDAYPRACVDCHTGKAGAPPLLTAILKQWSVKVDAKDLARMQAFAPKGMTLKGKHPGGAAIKDIPAACVKCHGAMAKLAPQFPAMIHGIHLTGGDANPFLTTFQGECTHCHKLSTTAQWSTPSGAEK
ncbi:MAG: hypothetical protein ABI837_02570 [Acidobacteriota bacterium]